MVEQRTIHRLWHFPWFRYCLRSFFAFVALVAIVLAWVAYEREQARRDFEIIAELEADGCVATIYQEPPFYDVDVRAFPASKLSRWQEWLCHIFGARICRLEIKVQSHDLLLEILSGHIKNRVSLAPITGLTNLRQLQIHGRDEIRLPAFDKSSNLIELDLTACSVQDFTPLSSLQKLQVLKLGGTNIADLAPLTGLDNLRVVDLDYTDVSDLAPLSSLRKLELLSLRSTQVGDVKPLSELHNLAELTLAGNPVSDVRPLFGLQRLTILDLYDTQVIHATPPALFKNRPWLWLNLAPEGIEQRDQQCEQLQKRFPNCKVNIW